MGLNVGRRVVGRGESARRETKRLSAGGREERAGGDKGGEVYHERSSAEEETPSTFSPPSPLPSQPTVETVSRREG